MALTEQLPSRFCGYRTPFSDEACSERHMMDQMRDGLHPYLPVARQFQLFGVERIDLLALDSNAVPCVFEFKRDVATHAVISQLLTYGSFVLGYDIAELEKLYKPRRKGASLRGDFFKRFGKKLPPTHLPSRAKLVLAAYEFDAACRRVLQFLEDSMELVIGKVKIECHWNGRSTVHPEYVWLRSPTETRDVQPLQIGRRARTNFWVSLDHEAMPLRWEECIRNAILPMPVDWNADQGTVQKGDGIFVHLYNVPPDELVEDGSITDGLAAYAIVSGDIFNLWDRGQDIRLEPESIKRLKELPEPLWMMPASWVTVRQEGSIVSPSYVPDPVFDLPHPEPQTNYCSLRRIEEPEHVDFAMLDLKLNPHEAPF